MDKQNDISRNKPGEKDFNLATEGRPLLPYSFANKFGVVLYQDSDGKSILAYHSDCAFMALVEAQRFAYKNQFKLPLNNSLLAEDEFEKLLGMVYEQNSSEVWQATEEIKDDLSLNNLSNILPEINDLLEQVDDAPVIRLLNAVLTEAIQKNASDVHIETYPDYMLVRFRIDGVMGEVIRPPQKLAPLLISRIKVMAKLDIAEKRIPQDGRISLKIAGREVDVRVSTLPVKGGERVVMRLLDKQTGGFGLEKLGMPKASLSILKSIISKTNGIFLVTGPTGSGKTTTLYSALSELNIRNNNIMTVEDPVEYQLSGISQTQVNIKAGMTFAKGLRSILRQDPDIIMVGEIRDLETARIAVQFSLTGHLVMSTLHTNTAIGTITRLLDMQVESFLLSSCLVGVLAQRLVRKLCLYCRSPHMPSAEEMLFLDIKEKTQIYQPNGCTSCGQSGYTGRTGIYELIQITKEIRTLIHNKASEEDLKTEARKNYPSIQAEGVSKILAGVTSIEEVIRVIGDGE